MKTDLYNQDNLEVMKTLPDESIDVICIDPPYLYLKNQKLERPFDELKFFSECARLLTKNGFIVMFGRGESFYRWNTILSDLKFSFKEEIVWNKSHCTSPLMNLSRVHETISIFCKGKAGINKVKIPYLEMKSHDIDSIVTDIKRLKSTFNNTKSLDAVIDFLENNNLGFNKKHVVKNKIQVEGHTLDRNRNINVINSIKNGFNEKSIIRTDRFDADTFTKYGVNCDKRKKGDRCVDVIQGVEFGLNEKSIIKEIRNHYKAIHPTEKPVRLLERLLKLVIPMKKKKIVVSDWFSGSNSCCEAVINLQSEFIDIEFEFIGTEIDKEYFDAGKARIDKIQFEKQQRLFY